MIDRLCNFLSVLLHPILMPFYAFLFFYGQERYSYFYSISASLYLYFSIFLLVVFVPFYVMYVVKATNVFSNNCSYKNKVLVLSSMLLSYLIGFFIMCYPNFSLRGVLAIFQIFSVITVLNFFRFRGSYLNAYGLYSGGFSAFVVLLGKISGIDIFWPFVFSIFIFSVISFARMHIEKICYNQLLLAFSVGLLLGLLFLCFN